MHEIVKIEERRGLSPKKEKNAFSDNHMYISWFTFQLPSSNGVGSREGAYTHA